MKLKNILVFFYVWLLLEGVLRKWVLPSMSNALYLGKFVFAFIFAFIIISVDRKKIIKDHNIIIALTIYILYTGISFCIGALNYSPIVSILGLSVHIAYFPLFFIIPKVLTSKGQLFTAFRYFNIIILIVFILGIVQYSLPPDHIINKYVADTDYVAQVGNAVRITTIFPYIGLSQYFIVFSALFSLVFFMIKSKKNIIANINVVLGLVCVFMTGSRFALGFYLLTAVVFIIAAKPFKAVKLTKYRSLIIVVPILIYFSFQTNFIKVVMLNFESRIFNADSSEDRLLDVFTPFKFSENAGFFGHGLGVTANPSQAYIYNRSKLPSYWEEESERIVTEQGMLGFIILVIFRLTVLIYLFKVMRREKDKQLKGLLLFFCIYQIPTVLVMSQTNFVYIENVIYCTQIGVLFFVANYQKKRLRYESNSI